MQRTRASALKHSISFRADPIQMRRRANLLPIKSMLYAISHALSDPSIKADARHENTRRRISGLSKHFSRLFLLASDYGTEEQMSPPRMFGAITSAVHSYVNLFYALRPAGRESYIGRHSDGIGRRVSPENNLLIMPAIMAQRGERRSLAYSTIARSLYSMPARFLYDKSRAAMKVEALEHGMGIKSAREAALSRLSLSMSQVESLIHRIGDGSISPEADEMIKELFVNEIVAVSESEDMSLAEFVSEKLTNGNISFKVAHRLRRK